MVGITTSKPPPLKAEPENLAGGCGPPPATEALPGGENISTPDGPPGLPALKSDHFP